MNKEEKRTIALNKRSSKMRTIDESRARKGKMKITDKAPPKKSAKSDSIGYKGAMSSIVIPSGSENGTSYLRPYVETVTDEYTGVEHSKEMMHCLINLGKNGKNDYRILNLPRENVRVARDLEGNPIKNMVELTIFKNEEYQILVRKTSTEADTEGQENKTVNKVITGSKLMSMTTNKMTPDEKFEAKERAKRLNREYKDKLKDAKRQGKPIKLSKSRFKRALSFNQLEYTIRGYGFDYSLGNYLMTMGLFLLGVIVAANLLHVKAFFIILIAAFTLLAVPRIILAQYDYIANSNKFEQLVAYLEQMIISFKATPKILTALKNTLAVLDGDLKVAVQRAIDIIETDSTSDNVYEMAFAIIEQEYQCSRMVALHKCLLTIERKVSTGYEASIDNLYKDIREWVKRVYKFQAELKAVKSKITILILASLAFAGFFSYILFKIEVNVQNSGDGMKDFSIMDGYTYQIATVVYLLGFVFLYTIVNSKLNGFWFANDLSQERDAFTLRLMNKIESYNPRVGRTKRIIFAVIGGLLAFAVMMTLNFMGTTSLNLFTVILITGAAAVLFYNIPKLDLDKKKKTVDREIAKEFPLWLRNVAINLNGMVVVKAIEDSIETASAIMKPFIYNFLEEIQDDPVTILPYKNFLGRYNKAEFSTATQTLYSIRILDDEEAQKQINDLVERNENLLAEAERLRHEDSISGVSFLGLIPMLMMSFYLMITMFAMMAKLFSLMTLATGGGL